MSNNHSHLQNNSYLGSFRTKEKQCNYNELAHKKDNKSFHGVIVLHKI